jgi:SPP1 family predicted phage head-tail adaptor
MIAGLMDRNITIQKRTLTQNSTGEQVETWEDEYIDIFAEVYEKQGRESFEGHQNTAYTETMFTIYWIAGINAADHRIIYDELIYDIDGPPAERGRREFLQIKGKFKDSL